MFDLVSSGCVLELDDVRKDEKVMKRKRSEVGEDIKRPTSTILERQLPS